MMTPNYRRGARVAFALSSIAWCVFTLWACPSAAQILDESADGYKGAQVRGTTLSIGFNTARTSLDEPSEDDPNAALVDRDGAGGCLEVGYTFSPRFNLRLAVTGAQHDTAPVALDASFVTGVIEAQYRFASASAVRPYLMGGIGGALLAVEDGRRNTLELDGAAARIGVGLHANMFKTLLVDLGLDLDFINLEDLVLRGVAPNGSAVEFSTPVDGELRALRLTIGLEYAF